MKSGRLVCGPLNGSAFISFVYPATSRTGAVSPMPRAMASTTAVARPERAVGSTTFQTVRHWPFDGSVDLRARDDRAKSTQKCFLSPVLVLRISVAMPALEPSGRGIAVQPDLVL